MPDPQTKLISVEAIRPNHWNPNVVPPEIFDALVENVRRFGFVQSVAVREFNEQTGETEKGTGVYQIIDGEHRWRAGQEAGASKIPATISYISEQEAKAETLALNRIRGQMDPTGVAQIFAELVGDYGMPASDLAQFTGYAVPQIDAAVALLSYTPPEPDETPDPDEEWKTWTVRLPIAVWTIVDSEMTRLRGMLGGDVQDFQAVEMMAVNSAQTPEESVQ
jgi:ParB/RepB/Spo0J family partition protein